MAFVQLTYRESLRDIEVCLDAQAPEVYHRCFHSPVRRFDAGGRQRATLTAAKRGLP
jgi:hypothetical protein